MKERFSKRLNHKLGLGTWQFGGPNFVDGKPTGWGNFDEKEGIDTLVFALENGIRFFDTADSYGRGLSEIILGKAIQENPKKDIIICTKFGNRELQKDQFVQDFSGKWLSECVEKSLNRLQVNCLDVLLFHSPPDNFDWHNYDTSELDTLIKKGHIKQFGVSSKSVYGAKRVMDDNFGSVIEVIYNIFDRRAEELIFSNSNKEDYDIISRVPLASGFLVSKNLKNAPTFNHDDYRSRLSKNDVDWLLEQLNKIDFLEKNELGLTTNAIKFCLQNPDIAVAIPGARNKAQVQGNLKALNIPNLSEATLQKITQLIPDVPDWWKPKL